MLLGVMAMLALFLGLFLVYNTINAIITQQTDQIGVMKAIGASSLANIGHLCSERACLWHFGLNRCSAAWGTGRLGTQRGFCWKASMQNQEHLPFHGQRLGHRSS